jgi:hypothetical protein
MAAFVGIIIEPQKQVFKSTDSREGSYSAEIKTKHLGDTLGNMSGFLCNAEMSVDFGAILPILTGGGPINASLLADNLSFIGGTTISDRVDTVSAWVKTGSGNMDNSVMLVSVQKTINSDSSVEVGSAYLIIPKNLDQFTKVNAHVLYTSSLTPDKLVVLFESSDMLDSTRTEDNDMKVDGASYSYATTGIMQPLLSQDIALVYPNPADNVVYFNLNEHEKAADYALTITDASGRIVKENALNNHINAINVAQWATGLYFYNLTNVKTHKSETGKFTVK